MENPLIKTLLSCFCISIEGLDEDMPLLVSGSIVFPEIVEKEKGEKEKGEEVIQVERVCELEKIANQDHAKTFVFKNAILVSDKVFNQKEIVPIIPKNESELDSSQYQESIQKLGVESMPKFPPNDMIEKALVNKIIFRVVRQELKPISSEELISYAIKNKGYISRIVRPLEVVPNSTTTTSTAKGVQLSKVPNNHVLSNS
jgi:hypothetical protein